MKRNKIKVKLKMEKTGFVSGENINFWVEVRNIVLKISLYTVVWSSLGHPLGSTQKVPCRRQCLTGDPFIHCKLAKWEQPKGALQAKVPYRGGALQGHDHCTSK